VKTAGNRKVDKSSEVQRSTVEMGIEEQRELGDKIQKI
jgi:hypothetical protein